MSLIPRGTGGDRGRDALAGKRIAITGGASGIGAATAALLAARGATVWIGDHDADGAATVAQRLRAAGGDARSVALDVTDESSFNAFLDAASAEAGEPAALDVLINNAGVMWVGPFAEEPASSVQRQIAVNLVGPILGTRLAAARMRTAGGGHIVTVASAASKLSPAGEATYSATKHGVYGYLRAVRRELRGTGVALTVIMPAVVDTDLAVGTSTGAAALLTPESIAQAIADALRHRRFEVHVPRSVALLDRLQTLAPQPLRDLIDRLAVPDQVRTGNRAVRAAYERKSLG